MKDLIKTIAIGLSFSLAACQSSLETPYKDYVQRMARVVALTPVQTINGHQLAYPRQREWTVASEPNIKRKTLSLLKFLSLDDCELRYVIARRNSALGKVASHSQRLHYQLDFLQHAPACIATLTAQGKTATATQLTAVMNEKKQQLPVFIWKGSLGEKEFRQFWQTSYLDADYPANTGTGLITALEQINGWVDQWLSGDYTNDVSAYENSLSVIRAGDGGALSRALSIQNNHLSQANTLLINKSLIQQRLCPNGLQSGQAEVFQNVVTKFWIHDLQLRSADLSRRYFDLIYLVEALEKRLADGEPRAYLDWRQQRNKLFEQWLGAPKAHSLRISSVYKHCDITLAKQ